MATRPRNFAASFATWLAVGIIAAWLVGPHILNSPTKVEVNGVWVQARANERVVDVVKRAEPAALHNGDLLNVNGGVLEAGGGDAPTIWLGDRIANSTDLARWYHEVRVRSGADVTEATEVVETWPHLKFSRKGSGPIPVVRVNGVVVPTQTTVGKVSRIKLSSEPAGEAKEPQVSYLAKRTGARKYVALTFDDGPNPGETEQILDILRDEKVVGTFFVIGAEAEKYPELVLRAASEGHQIAMHSWSHKEYTKLTPAQIREDVARCSSAVEEITGFAPTWIRPPYGQVDGTVYTELENLKLRVALWDVDPIDYSRPGTQYIINTVVYNSRPGSVVLFHDGGGNRSQTVAALRGIIGELRDAGYTFVTVEKYGQVIGQ